MPGKINMINTSINAKRYEWQMWLTDSEDGNLFQSSTYGYNMYTDENPSFYIQENRWVEIQLLATNALMESSYSKRFEITNVPSTLTIGDLVVTHVNLRDENGYEWDDSDGTPDFGDYSNSNAYPDLIVNTEQWTSNYAAADVQQWNVDIENDLPFTMPTETEVIESFSPQTNDVFVELVDFDGNQGSIFSGPGKKMGHVTFNPYYLTHKQNKGEETNYPSVYKIVTDNYEADLHLSWE